MPLISRGVVGGSDARTPVSVGDFSNEQDDSVQALVRNSPNLAYFSRIATCAALAAGARLRYD